MNGRISNNSASPLAETFEGRHYIEWFEEALTLTDEEKGLGETNQNMRAGDTIPNDPHYIKQTRKDLDELLRSHPNDFKEDTIVSWCNKLIERFENDARHFLSLEQTQTYLEAHPEERLKLIKRLFTNFISTLSNPTLLRGWVNSDSHIFFYNIISTTLIENRAPECEPNIESYIEHLRTRVIDNRNEIRHQINRAKLVHYSKTYYSGIVLNETERAHDFSLPSLRVNRPHQHFLKLLKRAISIKTSGIETEGTKKLISIINLALLSSYPPSIERLKLIGQFAHDRFQKNNRWHAIEKSDHKERLGLYKTIALLKDITEETQKITERAVIDTFIPNTFSKEFIFDEYLSILDQDGDTRDKLTFLLNHTENPNYQTMQALFGYITQKGSRLNNPLDKETIDEETKNFIKLNDALNEKTINVTKLNETFSGMIDMLEMEPRLHGPLSMQDKYHERLQLAASTYIKWHLASLKLPNFMANLIQRYANAYIHCYFNPLDPDNDRSKTPDFSSAEIAFTRILNKREVIAFLNRLSNPSEALTTSIIDRLLILQKEYPFSRFEKRVLINLCLKHQLYKEGVSLFSSLKDCSSEIKALCKPQTDAPNEPLDETLEEIRLALLTDHARSCCPSFFSFGYTSTTATCVKAILDASLSNTNKKAMLQALVDTRANMPDYDPLTRKSGPLISLINSLLKQSPLNNATEELAGARENMPHNVRQKISSGPLMDLYKTMPPTTAFENDEIGNSLLTRF